MSALFRSTVKPPAFDGEPRRPCFPANGTGSRERRSPLCNMLAETGCRLDECLERARETIVGAVFEPGSNDGRLHATYDPAEGRFSQL